MHTIISVNMKIHNFCHIFSVLITEVLSVTNCPKKCPYKNDGKCSVLVPIKGGSIYFSLENQCPYYENTISSSHVHTSKIV